MLIIKQKLLNKLSVYNNSEVHSAPKKELPIKQSKNLGQPNKGTYTSKIQLLKEKKP